MQLSNYLFFKTGCEQALAFYEQCGLGRVVELVPSWGTGHDPGHRGDARPSDARQVRRARYLVLCI